MAEKLSIVLGQLNFHVGNVSANLEKIKSSISLAIENFQADLIVFPELALTGYPPEDLLHHKGLKKQVSNALLAIESLSQNIGIIIGFPDYQGDAIYNAAALFYQGKRQSLHHKQLLPNYGVFDEQRYFVAGDSSTISYFKGCQLGILICEDIWADSPILAQKAQGAELIISINASPFDNRKLDERQRLLKRHTSRHSLAMIYVQTVGGQDELIFDGGSMAVNSQGQITHTAQFFAETLLPLQYDLATRDFLPPHFQTPPMSRESAIYHALMMGIKDYVHKNGFKGVVLGLSGGIDSALTLVLAVDALGADNVNAVMMPSQFTSQMSLDDAATLAENTKVHYEILSIDAAVDAFESTLKPLFNELPSDTTEENIQARCRGTLLMALSNKYNWLVLTTGNKSEMAVGYATLYGDMAGGFGVLKDVPKQLVYQLSNYRNQQHPVIPERIITREPSAELAHDQQDSDSLPSYDILDKIIECYIENDMDRDLIIKQGFTQEVVDRVLKLIDRSEYKRRQAPPGIRITPRALSRDRRYPITSGFCHQGIHHEKD